MLLHQFQIYRARTRQKRKALRMLALSGVVRPSHVELRYAMPFLNLEDQSGAFQGTPVTAVRSSHLLQKFFELMSWPRKIRVHLRSVIIRTLKGYPEVLERFCWYNYEVMPKKTAKPNSSVKRGWKPQKVYVPKSSSTPVPDTSCIPWLSPQGVTTHKARIVTRTKK